MKLIICIDDAFFRQDTVAELIAFIPEILPAVGSLHQLREQRRVSDVVGVHYDTQGVVIGHTFVLAVQSPCVVHIVGQVSPASVIILG